MERKKLLPQEIERNLNGLNDWKAENDILSKRFEFRNFAEALNFINQVGAIAETHNHHPDIYFGWGYAEINLTTHDRGGITDFDFAVARDIETIVRETL